MQLLTNFLKTMKRLKVLWTTLIVPTILGTSLPILGATRSNFYLPNEHFCAVYQGSIHREYKFIVSVKQENQLIIQADNNLNIAVIRQGKIITPYQINLAETSPVSQWSYYTKSQEKHIISVKGHRTNTKIRLCLY